MLPLISIRTPVFPTTELRPALFVDRDDTLMPDKPYLADPDGVSLYPDACAALSRFRAAGWRLFLVSNQSGVGRGLITAGQLTAVHHRLTECLAAGGVQLDGAYYCPHAPEDGCACRKPLPGLFLQAMADFATDTAASIMLGDRAGDIEAAHAAGLRAALITACGRETPSDNFGAEFVFASLTAAADAMLK